ncbi:response regulator [candidate division KSB1 bacterium]|nr:MAG: response regulator [candidate division KSB1 bacterium]
MMMLRIYDEPGQFSMLNSTSLKIYLILNEKLITQTLDEFLSRLDYQVITLHSIEELHQVLRNQSKDGALIICGQRCFRGSEQAIIRNLYEQNHRVHFIVITEDAPELSMPEAISLGIYGYLHKPISLAELELLLVRLNEKNQE